MKMIYKQTIQDWYKAEDKLPEVGEEVFVRLEFGDFLVMFILDNDLWYEPQNMSTFESVGSVWSYLPKTL
jgi:hypothetical protein